MKVTFGEYSAFTTKSDSIRYQKNNKLVSKTALPAEVVAYLDKQLGQEPNFAHPTPEETAKLREESLKVPVELQRTEEEAEIESFEAQAEEALTSADFDDGNDMWDEVPKSDLVPEQVLEPTVDPDFLESVSIHTASLKDIAEALYERFGIYTVYLDKFPENQEVNPLTGEQFTKYHLGIAYQASIYAKNKGILNRPPEEGRKAIDASRDAIKNFKVDEVPRTMGEARKANSFAYRTSVAGNRPEAATEIVHVTDENGIVRAIQKEIPAGQTGEFNGAKAKFNKEDDQLIVEPQFGKKVIRPNW